MFGQLFKLMEKYIYKTLNKEVRNKIKINQVGFIGFEITEINYLD